ncbi:MAG: hypothetical protein JWN13_5715, partial [Betaproteobacteria bacterium]|nr:hypothetical protein [Betaproteobacteria bacterium]
MRPAAEAEKLGIPSVVITNSGFASLARIAAKATGVNDLRVAQYPGALGIDDRDKIEERISSVLIDNIIDGLTAKTAGQETAAGSARLSPREIVFTGSAQHVNRYFAKQDWTDGLP